MKTILEFNLPDDEDSLEMAQSAHAFHSVLWDLNEQILRPVTKYGVPDSLRDDIRQSLNTARYLPNEQLDEVIKEVYHRIRASLNELEQDNNIAHLL